MNAWLSRYAALMLLLVLPLQGAAAALMPLTCFTGTSPVETVVPAHEHHDGASHAHAPGMPSTGDHHDSDTSGEFAGHLCCHHVFTGAPSLALPTTPRLPAVYDAYVPAAPVPFVPERLQRPPRA